MSTDLTLIPADDWHTDRKTGVIRLVYSTTLLRCGAARLLRHEFDDSATHQVNRNFLTFRGKRDSEPSSLVETPYDGYGSPLMWMRAGDIVKISSHDIIQKLPKNKAVWAYLKCIDPATPVALYWH